MAAQRRKLERSIALAVQWRVQGSRDAMLESFRALSERMRGRGETLWRPSCIRMLKVIFPDSGSGGRSHFRTSTLRLIKEGFRWITHLNTLSFWGKEIYEWVVAEGFRFPWGNILEARERTLEKNTADRAGFDHGEMTRQQDNVSKQSVNAQSPKESLFPIFIRVWSRKYVCMLIQNSNTIKEVKLSFKTTIW